MKNNGQFMKISKKEIEQALKTTSRQYFVGNLQLPQIIEHIQDKDIEIGISSYTKETEEAAHWHPVQKEFQYVLAGRTIYTNVITREQYEYKTGDFYAIYPEVCYHQISDHGTKILFIKIPSIDDKVQWKGETS